MRLEVFIITLLAASFLIVSGINAQVVFSTVPWQISYSKYRLWYEVYIPYNTTGAYINISIPKTVLDDVAKYCYDHNYTRCDILFPRIYYYNETTGQQIEMDNRLINVTSWYIYNNSTYYPINFTLFYPYYLLKGYHYFVIYYPWYFWEDWEELPIESYSTTGSCLSNGWCIVSSSGYKSVSTEEYGWLPTPRRRLCLHVYTPGFWVTSYITVKRDVNIPVNPNYPMYLVFNHSGRGCIGVTFLLKDGTTQTLVYNYGYCNKAGFPNVCNTTSVSETVFKHDILDDIAKYCYYSPENVEEIESIYMNVYVHTPYDTGITVNSYIDNIQLIPADLSNYYP